MLQIYLSLFLVIKMWTTWLSHVNGVLTRLEYVSVNTIFQQITNYGESIILYYLYFHFHVDFLMSELFLGSLIFWDWSSPIVLIKGFALF